MAPLNGQYVVRSLEAPGARTQRPHRVASCLQLDPTGQTKAIAATASPPRHTPRLVVPCRHRLSWKRKETGMIELNGTLQQALDAHPGEPLHLVDPRTQQTYVLLPAQVDDRLQPALLPECGGDIAPGIRRSKEAFLRDLPSLLADRKSLGLWTAYHGAERIGIARDARALMRQIQRRG